MVGISFDYPHELGAGFDRLNAAQIVRPEKKTPPVRSRKRIKYGTAKGWYGMWDCFWAAAGWLDFDIILRGHPLASAMQAWVRLQEAFVGLLLGRGWVAGF
jgi:hypothetical protein